MLCLAPPLCLSDIGVRNGREQKSTGVVLDQYYQMSIELLLGQYPDRYWIGFFWICIRSGFWIGLRSVLDQYRYRS